MDVSGAGVRVHEAVGRAEDAGHGIAGVIRLFSEELQGKSEDLADLVCVGTGFEGALDESHDRSDQKTGLCKGCEPLQCATSYNINDHIKRSEMRANLV